MEGGGGWQVSGGRRGPRHSRTLQAPQRLLVLSGRETGAGIDCACVQGKQQRRLQEGLQVRGFNEEPPTLRSRGAGGGRDTFSGQSVSTCRRECLSSQGLCLAEEEQLAGRPAEAPTTSRAAIASR